MEQSQVCLPGHSGAVAPVGVALGVHVVWARLLPVLMVLLGLGLGWQYRRQKLTEGVAVAIMVVLGVVVTVLQGWLGL
jgi:hypothetical protein